MKATSAASMGLILSLFLAAVACDSDDDPEGSSSSSGQAGGSSSGGSSGASSSSSSSSGGTSSSGGSSSSSSSGGDAGTESLSAIVTDVHLTQNDACTLDLTVPAVDTPSDAADAKILQAIPQTASTYCEAGETLTYGGDYEVHANEWGVLSISLAQDYYYEGAAHPDAFVVGHNFDIATGDELTLTAVVNAAGLDQLQAACVARLTSDPDLQYDADQAQDTCNTSIHGFDGEGGGNYQIEKTDLRLYLELSHAEAAVGLEGVTVTWADLGANVISPLVQTFVSKQ